MDDLEMDRKEVRCTVCTVGIHFYLEFCCKRDERILRFNDDGVCVCVYWYTHTHVVSFAPSLLAIMRILIRH